ncbi:YcxB family protein [Rhizobium halophytocola]|uniref:YcxB family protein n=1 Tax=Rhizobium halophytocola TaxID=735519 RepID=UPI0031581FDF
MALCAFWAVYDKVQDPDPGTLITLIAAAIGLVSTLILVKRVVLPFRGARNARGLAKSCLIVAEQHLTPTGDGFDIRLSDGHRRYLRSDFTGLAEDERMMLLFQVGNVYRPLPKRAFNPEQRDSFLAAARAHIAEPQGFRLTLCQRA